MPRSFLWPNNVPLRGRTPFWLLRSSGDGHVGCFSLLVVVNHAVLNMEGGVHVCGRAFLVLWGASPRGGVLGPRVTLQLTYGSPARLSLYPSPGSMPSVTSLWGPDSNRWGSLLGTLIVSAAESPRVLFSSSTQKISAFKGSPDALSFLCVCVR